MNAFRKISVGAFSLSLLLFILSYNRKIATLLNGGICAFLRVGISKITGVVRFSLFELIFFCLPLLIFLLVLYTVRTGRIKNVICAFLIIPTLYFFNLGIAYNAKTDLSREGEVSDAEIIDTAWELVYRVNSYEGEKIARRTLEYQGIKVKEIAASPLLMHTGTLGFYSFFTSEANVNNLLPDYVYYFTAFHEISHVLGYAREGEASLFAYRALKESRNSYYSFCAELYTLQELLKDVYKISSAEYESIMGALGKYPTSMLKEYRELIKKYPQAELVAGLAGAHLSLWDGASYSDFSRLIVLCGLD